VAIFLELKKEIYMLNYIWFALIVFAILYAGGQDIISEIYKDKSTIIKKEQKEDKSFMEDKKLGQVTTAVFNASKQAVEIALGLIGIMALWLGILRVGEAAGLTKILARIVKPITRRLFPSIPSDHPAISAMVMNIASSWLGLSNAATPLGLKAMNELNKLNPKKGEATDDMCTFLVLNTSAITFIPATAIAVRASLGSANPQMIIIPSILAASCATIVGITVVKMIQAGKRRKIKEKR
jgi:spore maturation protein A